MNKLLQTNIKRRQQELQPGIRHEKINSAKVTLQLTSLPKDETLDMTEAVAFSYHCFIAVLNLTNIMLIF